MEFAALIIGVVTIIVTFLGFNQETLAARLYPNRLKLKRVVRVSDSRSMGRLTMTYPRATGPGGEALNSVVEALCTDAIVEFNSMEDEREDLTEPAHQPHVNMEVLTSAVTRQLVSIVCGSDFFSMYRANVYQRFEARTLSFSDGRTLRLADVIVSIDSLTLAIRRLCRDTFGDPNDEDCLWMTDYDSFELDPSSISFFFWKGGFVLPFSKYELGPGAAGCAAISISWEDISRHLPVRILASLDGLDRDLQIPSSVEYGIGFENFVNQQSGLILTKLLRRGRRRSKATPGLR